MNAPKEFSADYLKYLSSLLEKLNNEDIARFINQILDVRENNRKIFFIGNGGSASTASHFVNDISLGSRQFENPFKAISLCDNQAVITAIANDDGYENIFLEQQKVYEVYTFQLLEKTFFHFLKTFLIVQWLQKHQYHQFVPRLPHQQPANSMFHRIA